MAAVLTAPPFPVPWDPHMCPLEPPKAERRGRLACGRDTEALGPVGRAPDPTTARLPLPQPQNCGK